MQEIRSDQSKEDDAPTLKVERGRGSWRHAAFHVATTIATPAAYSPLPFAMASLGWPAGTAMLITGTLVTWYSSLLVASLWKWDGFPRVRYRDLARSIFGKPGFWTVTFFQQVASIGNNVTIQIAAGISMKSIYKAYHNGNYLTLQEFIIVFGAFQLALSQFPDIHSLRWVNGICTLSTLGFTATAIGLSVHNGKDLDRSSIDYKLHGTMATKFFNFFTALGTIAFSFGDAMLPEIQSTLKEPVRKNMYKGISAAYVVIISTYWAVSFVGYWAFGSMVNPYLLNSFTGPRWAITLANLFSVIQIAGCYQIYCRPTYAFFESKFMFRDKEPLSFQNCIVRMCITTIYISVVTVTASALPFFGDFVALCGAIGFTPLDFVLPALAYLTVKRPENWIVRFVNINIVIIYSCVAILGSIGAIRFITIDTKTYKLFKNM